MAPRYAALLACAAAYALAASTAWALAPLMVFFESGSTRITPYGRGVIDNTAAAIIDSGARDVLIQGTADRVGSRSYNLALGLRRAEAVKAALVARGIPAARIQVETFGEDRPLVPTEDGVAEAQNRSATISLREMCNPPPFMGPRRAANC